jgi:hypothetical protein
MRNIGENKINGLLFYYCINNRKKKCEIKLNIEIVTIYIKENLTKM